jgi:N-acetylneuraminate synthase
MRVEGGLMGKPQLIAEIGCNHKGDFAIALDMVETAARFCKVDAVKFQKRKPSELLSEDEYRAPHPNPINAYGQTYGEHREFLEFTVDQHLELMDLCKRLGLTYGTSVWDVTSAKEMAAVQPQLLKVPSASNLHFEMLDVLCQEHSGEIHVSLGMTTRDEERQLVEFFEARGRASSLVLYSCTSGYPVDFGDLCLLEITRLREAYEGRVKAIAFSGHHLGIAADIAAVTLGAKYVERHFTMDRTWKGTDHSASLEPDGMRRLARDIKAVSAALTYKSSEILPVELATRDKLKWVPSA